MQDLPINDFEVELQELETSARNSKANDKIIHYGIVEIEGETNIKNVKSAVTDSLTSVDELIDLLNYNGNKCPENEDSDTKENIVYENISLSEG